MYTFEQLSPAEQELAVLRVTEDLLSDACQGHIEFFGEAGELVKIGKLQGFLVAEDQAIIIQTAQKLAVGIAEDSFYSETYRRQRLSVRSAENAF